MVDPISDTHSDVSQQTQGHHPALRHRLSWREALTAPLLALRFLFQHPFLFLLGLLPQILGLCALGYGTKLAIAHWLDILTPVTLADSWWHWLIPIMRSAGAVFLFLVAVILYPLVMAGLVNALGSPLYDFLSEKVIFHHLKVSAPRSTLPDIFKGIAREILKTLIVLIVFALSFLFPFLAPLSLLFTLWYFGWEQMDRTLAIWQWPLRRRLRFGMRNAGACLSLGLWSYIPLLGTLFAFTFSVAGALILCSHPRMDWLLARKGTPTSLDKT